jgi:hypothetical protein
VIPGRAISVPLTPVKRGYSRSLPDVPNRRSAYVRRQIPQIPKLTVRCLVKKPIPPEWRSTSEVLITLQHISDAEARYLQFSASPDFMAPANGSRVPAVIKGMLDEGMY